MGSCPELWLSSKLRPGAKGNGPCLGRTSPSFPASWLTRGAGKAEEAQLLVQAAQIGGGDEGEKHRGAKQSTGFTGVILCVGK